MRTRFVRTSCYLCASDTAKRSCRIVIQIRTSASYSLCSGSYYFFLPRFLPRDFRSGNRFTSPVLDIHFSNVPGGNSPLRSITANLRICALLLNGISVHPSANAFQSLAQSVGLLTLQVQFPNS